MSKNEKVDKHEVNLDAVVHSLEVSLKSSIDKYNGKIVHHGLPTINSSTSLLFVALKNLIENGLKFNQSNNPTIELSYRSTASEHEIIITDNGIGIEKAFQQNIFTMFKRLHNRTQYEGTGIGLAIVKLAMDKLEGKVLLDSQPGKGSTFILRFPK